MAVDYWAVDVEREVAVREAEAWVTVEEATATVTAVVGETVEAGMEAVPSAMVGVVMEMEEVELPEDLWDFHSPWSHTLEC